MIAPHLLWLFIGALSMVYLLPGADMALILQTSLRSGFRHGAAVAAGLALARGAHVTLSACGLAALLRNAPVLYAAVRLAGALYLAWLAWQIFRSTDAFMPTAHGTEHASLRKSVIQGWWGNLLNPKALLFCSVLLPQFVRPARGAIGLQMLELGSVLVLMGLAFDCTLALGATRIARWLRMHPKAQRFQRWSFSIALLAFALRLSLD